MALVNRKAIYAGPQPDAVTPATLTGANAIPVSDITNTPLVANTVERDELTGFFGAPGSAVASKTQSISVTSPIIGGGLSSEGGKEKSPLPSPLDPLIQACYHKVTEVGTNLSTPNSSFRGLIYSPIDTSSKYFSLVYQFDTFTQRMVNMRGTMSFTLTTGAFSTMTFELQSSFLSPAPGGIPTGARPTFQKSRLVTGNGTLRVPGLPDEFTDCIRSFSFTQGVTISEKDCATKAGDNPITYDQTARNATGEIVMDITKEQLARLYAKAGTEEGFSAPINVLGSGATAKPGGLIVFGTKPGNTFVFGSNQVLIGAPTEGDADGIGTYTIPLIFKPTAEGNDYQFGFIGDVTS